MAKSIQNVLSSLSGAIRRETLSGRAYIVAPMTMLVEGVLNGSNGPLFYAADEFTKNADNWNGMPITVYHPTQNGSPVSARDPDILDSQGVGLVLKTQAGEKLQAEAWFDIEALKKIDERILNKLEAGEKIELSTGLYAEAVPAEENATFNGKAYTHIARNLRPDHLAILPDQIGACSVNDGCGILNKENKDGAVMNLNNRVREYLTKKKLPLTEVFTANELSFDDVRSTLREAISAKFLQSEPSAWIYDVYDGFCIYEQGNTMYRQEYSKSDTGVTLTGKPVEVVREVSFVPVSNGENTMAMNEKQKRATVDFIIANTCGCWEEADREALNKFDEKKLTGLKTNAEKHKELEAKFTANADPEEGDGDDAGDDMTGDTVEATRTNNVQNKGKKKVEKVADKVQKTDAEWLADAPPTIRSAVQNAMTVEKREKQAIVSRLTANVEDEAQKKQVTTRLLNKSVEELQDLLALLPTTNEEEETSRPFYFGQAPVTNRTRQSDKDDILPLPVINWNDKAAV